MRKFVTINILILLTILLTMPVIAQDNAIATGLISPRGIAYDSAGNLYIAEAGSGGDLQIEGMFGPMNVGGTGELTRLDADGRIEVLVHNLPSQGPADSARGAQDVMVTEDAIWLLVGQAGGLPLSQTLLKLDPETLRIVSMADFYAVESELNPDGDIIESNPTSFDMTEDGVFYIADASCNCVMIWTEGSTPQIFTSWDIDDNPVPTAVALGNNNDLYVGFLSGFPFPEGGSRIEHWSLDGELLETFEGLTAVVDVLVTDDSTVYAVEHGVFNDTGWSAGRVIRVSADDVEVVADGLNRPWGLAITPEGDLAVVIDSVSDAGSVIRVPLGG